MGLSGPRQTLVAPAPEGASIRATGKPIDRERSLFRTSTKLADKGFSSRPTILIAWARTGSLMWMTFGLACCAVEMIQPRCRATTSSASVSRRAVRRASPT